MIDYESIFDNQQDRELQEAIEKDKAASLNLFRTLISSGLVTRRSLETVTLPGQFWKSLSDFRKENMASVFLKSMPAKSISILEDGTGKTLARASAFVFEEEK